ncbi:MAG TPA: FeoB-associated Cys-rich membrane protein [Candidatus Limiplasma sp.]|nr:FeoB-associated Cys-rich membrane protein [Candidatus Limiplasma sp.]HRX08851.1 FeoB-associated Cys-rich membrane protein [Candidatus Limiplasma sp.]
MATYIVGGIVLLIVGGIVWKIIADKKKGKGCCGGDCGQCNMSCHTRM